jgi:hypothetical protein
VGVYTVFIKQELLKYFSKPKLDLLYTIQNKINGIRIGGEQTHDYKNDR